jgi:hypothetical protein
MKINQLKLIINAAEIADFEIDESKTIEENYENAYDVIRDYAMENQEEFEIVEGEFWNHRSHLHAMSEDGTNYECDGEIINGDEEGGEIIGDFIDKEGRMILVAFPKNEN